MRVWKIAESPTVSPSPVEDHGDGTFTAWTFTVWGPVGIRGKPKGTTVVREAEGRKEKEMIRLEEKAMVQSLQTQAVLVENMKFTRDMAKEALAQKS